MTLRIPLYQYIYFDVCCPLLVIISRFIDLRRLFSCVTGPSDAPKSGQAGDAIARSLEQPIRTFTGVHNACCGKGIGSMLLERKAASL